MRCFVRKIKQKGDSFRKRKIDVLHINMGKYCIQACLHCHIEAGPGRKDLMTRETVNAILRFLERSEILTVNITGRAPELTPSFDYLPVRSKQERALRIRGAFCQHRTVPTDPSGKPLLAARGRE